MNRCSLKNTTVSQISAGLEWYSSANRYLPIFISSLSSLLLIMEDTLSRSFLSTLFDEVVQDNEHYIDEEEKLLFTKILFPTFSSLLSVTQLFQRTILSFSRFHSSYPAWKHDLMCLKHFFLIDPAKLFISILTVFLHSTVLLMRIVYHGS